MDDRQFMEVFSLLDFLFPVSNVYSDLKRLDCATNTSKSSSNSSFNNTTIKYAHDFERASPSSVLEWKLSAQPSQSRTLFTLFSIANIKQ